MFDKRAAFNFYIVRIPSITSNILSIICYSYTMSEFVRIGRSTLLTKDFLPIAKNLLDRMINQGGFKHISLRQTKKAINRYPEAFQKYIIASDIVSKNAAT